MIEIKEGDFLLPEDGKRYAVKTVSRFSGRGLTPTLKRLAKVPVSVERRETVIETGLLVTPIDPASEDAYGDHNVMNAPVKLLETFVPETNGYVKLFMEVVKR